MKKTIFLIVIALVLVCNVHAKTKNSIKRSDGGIRAGSSFGFPAGSIPEGASGIPLPAISLGLFYSYKFTPKWSVQIGAETYSMKANFDTPYEDFEYIGNLGKYMPELFEDNGTIDTAFLKYAYVDGGRFNNKYIAVPVTAYYHFRKGWSLSFGGYVGYNYKKEMQGTATDISFGDRSDKTISVPVSGTMPFNESDKIKDWDFGMNVGGNYELKSGINFDLRINAGLTDMFVKEFSAPPSAYHNIVVQTTIGYRLGGTRRI